MIVQYLQVGGKSKNKPFLSSILFVKAGLQFVWIWFYLNCLWIKNKASLNQSNWSLTGQQYSFLQSVFSAKSNPDTSLQAFFFKLEIYDNGSFHFRKLPRPTWSACSRTPTSAQFTPREWPSCRRISSWHVAFVERGLKPFHLIFY